VQSPGKRELLDPTYEPKLKAYVEGVVGAFANDSRILGWDIWNEPDNGGGDIAADVPAKIKRVNELLPKAFAWARAMHPSQPLTSGVWAGTGRTLRRRAILQRSSSLNPMLSPSTTMVGLRSLKLESKNFRL